jgi:hypothetical protein
MFRKVGYLLAAIACLALVLPSLSCDWIKLATYQITYKPDLELRLEKAPRLNEPVKLTCIRRADERDKGVHEKITLEFERVDPKTRWLIKVPAQEVLAGGNLNWEGDMTGEPMEFSATLKFPYEGNWGIYARSTQPPYNMDNIFLNVGEESGSFGWVKDYAPMVDPYPDIPEERRPITVEFDMAKPPRLNEPFQITWGISTIRDIAEASGGVRFIHMEGTKEISIPAEDVLINGDVIWEGSLDKDNPLQFSDTVKLSEEGDWAIGSFCNSYIEQEPINSGSALYIYVSKDKGIWGWTKSHEKKPSGTLPPPIPTPVPQGSE